MLRHDNPTTRVASLATVALVLAVVLSTAAGPALASTQIETRDARLVVDQPHYINSEVATTTTNGSRIYKAKGPVLELHPQNFDPEAVVDYGTRTANASLEYDTRTQTFTFEPGATGTYELYWVVSEQVAVQPGNATGNDTATRTETRQVEYTATIRVGGQLSLVHQSPESLQETEQAAANWQEFNSTIHQRNLVGSASTGQTVQEMVNWYALRKNPTKALGDNIVPYLLLGITSTAILVWLFVFGGFSFIIRQLRKRLNVFEAVEAEEHAAKEAVAEMQRLADKQDLWTMDVNELDGFDDHVAHAWRETFGETVGESTAEYLSLMRPRTLVRDRLQAIGHDGYVAHVTDWTSADDGVFTDGGEREPAAVELVRERDLDADADDIIPLAGDEATQAELEQVLDALDSWDHPALRAADLTEIDFDTRDLDTTYESMDLETLGERLQVDFRQFEDEDAFGEYMDSFLRSVHRHPLCDEDGRPDEIRYVMGHFLSLCGFLDDRFGMPLVDWHRQAIARARLEYDPQREAREAIDRIEAGG